MLNHYEKVKTFELKIDNKVFWTRIFAFATKKRPSGNSRMMLTMLWMIQICMWHLSRPAPTVCFLYRWNKWFSPIERKNDRDAWYKFRGRHFLAKIYAPPLTASFIINFAVLFAEKILWKTKIPVNELGYFINSISIVAMLVIQC